MAPSKTERGRAALQAHATAGLSLAERRVLILCDGRRRREDLAALLGSDAQPILDRLLRDDYLTLHDGAAARPAGVEPPTTPGAIATPASAASQSSPRAASRRSLAASKMYVVDMLQLQRDPESASLRAEIQTSPSEEELVYRMMKALRHLQAVAATSYAQRIGERLAEILPEHYLPRLDQARTDWPGSMSAMA